jgi:5'-methylthioadenosine phosphorylase
MTNPPFDTRPEGRADDAPLGVLGGSGLYALDGLTELREEVVDTPFGRPSGPLLQGRLGGRRVVFLARHGAGHRLSPSEINYRANIHALKQAGVERLLSISAVGSLREAVAPGDLVLCDQLIDKTFRRASSFFGEGVVGHVSFAEPMCGAFVGEVAAAAESAGVRRVFRGGTYVCMEGPQFSTLAESLTYKNLGYSVIGMTNLPEAKLAREAEICYATVAMVTDFDCWHPDHDAVTVQDIIKVLTANADKAKRLVARLARDFPREHEPCPIGSDRALDVALITPPEARDPALLAKLDAVAGRVLGGRGMSGAQ